MSIPPPKSSPFKQWENTLGVIPREDNCDRTDMGPWLKPNIPLTEARVPAKSPDTEVVHLFPILFKEIMQLTSNPYKKKLAFITLNYIVFNVVSSQYS